MNGLDLFFFLFAMCSVTVALYSAGRDYSLFKQCNATAAYHGNALWVDLSAPMDCVVPFDNRNNYFLPARHVLPRTLTSSLNTAISS